MSELAKDARTPAAPDAEADSILDGLAIDWRALISLLVPEFVTEGKAGVTELLENFGLQDEVSWDEVAPAVQRAADERAAELVGMHRTPAGNYVPSRRPGMAITSATRDLLRATVRQAIAEGWTAAEIRKAIIENYAFSPARALTIARTETAFARGRGGLVSAKASGVITSKAWTLGEEACELCRTNAEQGPIALDGIFASGDECTPAHPNCRCSLSYSVAEQAA